MSAATPPAQRCLLGLLLALLLLAQMDQPYPEIALLQHIPTMLLIVTGPLLLRRWPLSTASVACIAAFMSLHTLGGRYAYSNVPYDDWGRALTGTSISDAFGWTRNHYDRFVHFAFGALSVIPVADIAWRWGGLGPRGAAFTVLGWVLAISCLYEISNGCSPLSRRAKPPTATMGSKATSGTRKRIWHSRLSVRYW